MKNINDIPYGVTIYNRLLFKRLGIWYIKWNGGKYFVRRNKEFINPQFISYGCDKNYSENKLDTIKFVLKKDLEKGGII
jgi:hypothetical protein